MKDCEAHYLPLAHDGQTIVLDGGMTCDDDKDFELTVDEVDVNKITPALEGLSFKGLINGEAKLHQDKEVFDPSADIHITNVAINDVDLGEFNLAVQGSETLE